MLVEPLIKPIRQPGRLRRSQIRKQYRKGIWVVSSFRSISFPGRALILCVPGLIYTSLSARLHVWHFRKAAGSCIKHVIASVYSMPSRQRICGHMDGDRLAVSFGSE